jgi:hypothetical protein
VLVLLVVIVDAKVVSGDGFVLSSALILVFTLPPNGDDYLSSRDEYP